MRLEQTDTTVRVTFENGVSDFGSFVVGCDGLHSSTRKELFGEAKASYTGLTQVSTLNVRGLSVVNPL